MAKGRHRNSIWNNNNSWKNNIRNHRNERVGSYEESPVRRHRASNSNTGVFKRIGEHVYSIAGAIRNPNKGK